MFEHNPPNLLMQLESRVARQHNLHVHTFVAKARKLLGPIINEPGRVLYGSAASLVRGDFYFLGLNPGGTGGSTIATSLAKLPSRSSNAYVHEEWWNKRGRFERGKHPLQRSAQSLFQILGTSVEQVCASNLIFTQSEEASGARYPGLACICWPVHELILSIVQPRTIICFGREPFEFLIHKLRLREGDSCPADHLNWQCRIAESNSLVLVGLPHLSRYSLSGKKRVTEWLRSKVRAN